MKSFIFVRGLERPERHDFSRLLLRALNPDVSHVTSIMFSLSDFPAEDIRSAHKTIKNHIKRVLINGAENFIIIDNENLKPQHWQPFVKLANDVNVLGDVIGINVTFPKKILNTEEVTRKNLHAANLVAFKADCTKYFEVEGNLNEFAEKIAAKLLEEIK